MKYRESKAPPDRWQDFEDLCLEIWRPQLLDAKKHGRTGQSQKGVDIFGRDPSTGEWIGVQCKQKGQWPPKALSTGQIVAEIELAETFEPTLSHFIIATTAQRDVATQAFVRQLSVAREKVGDFTVDLFSWDDIQEWLFELESKRSSRLQGAEMGFGAPSGNAERNDFFRHVPLPVHYVDRARLVEEVVELMLEETLATTCLHGMGGIGKSVLARAVCEDGRIRAAFPDGILWVGLGKRPDVELKVAELLELFGSANIGSTLDLKRAQLANQLADRACLLVLDDLWQPADAAAFRVGGRRCRLLITTRDAGLARQMLGARVHPIPPMSATEATRVLDSWSEGRFGESEASTRRKIVDRCGGLPLALRLAGAQLQRKEAGKWLHSFEVKALALPEVANPHDSLGATLDLSFDSLDPRQRELFWALSVFDEVERIPFEVIHLWWHQLEGLSADAAEEWIAALASKALLEIVEIGESREVLLHDLVRDALRERSGESRLCRLHREFLKAYAPGPSTVEWHEIDDDGYLYDHLAYHLRGAGLLDALRRLFADDCWLLARVMAGGFDYQGYLSDLSVAWDVVLAEVETRPQALADGFAYGLIESSIRSISLNFSPPLVRQALRKGVWPLEKAMRVAGRIVYHYESVKLFAACLEGGDPDEKQRRRLLDSALERHRAITEPLIEGESLVVLWPHLTKEQKAREQTRLPELLEAALQRNGYGGLLAQLCRIAVEVDGGIDTVRALQAPVMAALRSRERTDLIVEELSPVVIHFGTPVVEELVAEALASTDEEFLLGVLSTFAASLQADQLAGAVEKVEKLATSPAKLRLMAELARQADGHLAKVTARNVLLEALSEGSPESLAAVAPLPDSILGPKLGRRLTRAALAAVKEHRDREDGWTLLRALFDRALEDPDPPRRLIEGLGHKLRFALDGYVAHALLGWSLVDGAKSLAPHLGEAQKQQMLDRILDADTIIWTEALAELAPFLDGPLLQRALGAASRLDDQGHRARAFAAIAARQSDGTDLYLAALDAAHRSQSSETLTWMLGSLPPNMVDLVWKEARELHQVQWIEVLPAHLPQLGEQKLKEMLRLLSSPEWSDLPVRFIESAWPHCAGDRRLERCLLAATDRLSHGDKVGILCHLPREILSPDQQRLIEEALLEIGTWDETRWEASPDYELDWLCHLAVALSDRDRQRVFRRALQILQNPPPPVHFERALSALLRHASERELRPFVPLALEFAYPGGRLNEEPEPRSRRQIITAVAAGVSGALAETMLESVLALEELEALEEALGCLAPRLEATLLGRAYEAALGEETSRRTEILAQIGPYVEGDLFEKAREEAEKLAPAKARNWALYHYMGRVQGPGALCLMARWLHSSRIEMRGHYMSRCADSLFHNREIPREVVESMGTRLLAITEWQWP